MLGNDDKRDFDYEATEARAHKRWTLIGIAAGGLFLILLSKVIPTTPAFDLMRALAKEVGVVILAVFTISYLYEEGLARKHMQRFTAQLRAEIMKGQGAASTCAVIGIDEIFRERGAYERQFSIFSQLRDANGGIHVRLVARSGYTVIAHAAERFAEVIGKAARIEICVLDPRIGNIDLEWNVDVARADVISSLKALHRMVTTKLLVEDSNQRPAGQLTIALHRIPMLDSFLLVSSGSQQWCTWDLSFGRETSRKMVLMLDAQKPMGKNVIGRYDHVWSRAEKVLVYESRQPKTNILSAVIEEADRIEAESHGRGAA